MRRRGLTRGATARTAARRIAAGTRLRSAAPGAARRDTSEQGAPVGAQVESDAHVTLAVAQILEQLAAQLREKGLAVLGDRLAHVARQPNPLTPMPSKDSKDALLTAEDLAARLRCNLRTLRRWRHEGRLPDPVKIGTSLRWRPDDVDAWLARREAR